MPFVRCIEHPLRATAMDCAGHVLPLGYPNTAVVCGSDGCEEPGLAWLTRDESDAHKRGQRIFDWGNGVKIRVGDELVPI
jgi:hypothetical protein